MNASSAPAGSFTPASVPVAAVAAAAVAGSSGAGTGRGENTACRGYLRLA